jgi:hypothetical protein
MKEKRMIKTEADIIKAAYAWDDYLTRMLGRVPRLADGAIILHRAVLADKRAKKGVNHG